MVQFFKNLVPSLSVVISTAVPSASVRVNVVVEGAVATVYVTPVVIPSIDSPCAGNELILT